MFVKLILLVSILTSVLAADDDSCYNPEVDFYPYLGTKTAYYHVHGNITREPNCTPVQIWGLIRHGTRYPQKEKLPEYLTNLPQLRNEIVKNHEVGDGHLCPTDLLRLKNWEPDSNLRADKDTFLSEQGEEDLRQLALRLQTAFPEVLRADPQSFKQEDYVFRATNTERTQESMRSFMRGIFGRSEMITPVSAPENDNLLTAEKHCPAWKSDKSKTHEERDKFTAGSEFQGLIDDVSRRLGFADKLDFDAIKLMYDMCRFEAAWYVNKTSTWCTVFSKEDLKILEYREDLSYYYTDGPARRLSGEIGSHTLADMIEHFEMLESENTNQPKGVFYFAHSVTVQNLMAALNLNVETQPLLASNYKDSEERRYRTSIDGPFATNVVAVFYRCNDEKSPNKVSLHVAEKLVHLPGCDDGLCSWDLFKSQYDSSINTRSMDFCTANEAEKTDPSTANN